MKRSAPLNKTGILSGCYTLLLLVDMPSITNTDRKIIVLYIKRCPYE